MKSQKLVFFGNERLATAVSTATPVLKSLIEAGYEVAAIVSSYSPGQSRNARELEITKVAHENKIPLLLPTKTIEIKDQLESYGAPAAVLVAYGQIVPLQIIDIFPKGIINIHPSLLPKYRGPTPIEQAILDSAEQTGVSLMRLAAKMDAGPVFVAEAVDLDGSQTKQELADKLLQLGKDMLIKNLPAILNGSLQPKDQNEADASYTKLLTKGNSQIDWGKPAEQLEREVRAYAGWPKSRAKVFGHDVIITNARLAKDKNDGDLVMHCQPGWLEIVQLIAPSGRTISGADFVRGYKK